MRTHLLFWGLAASTLSVSALCAQNTNTNTNTNVNTLTHKDNVLDINANTYVDTFKSTEINAERRARDYEEAFYRLHKSHPSSNIYAIVKGISIDHISDMSLMPDESLVIISYGRGGYPRQKVVKVEEIEELGIRSIAKSPVRVYFPQSTDYVHHDHRDIHDVDDVPHHHLHGNYECEECEDYGYYDYDLYEDECGKCPDGEPTHPNDKNEDD